MEYASNMNVLVTLQGSVLLTCLWIGLNTGTGIPAVFPKWVMQVQVWYSILSHRATLHTHTHGYGYFTG